jgi:hypothetical protein
MNNQLFVFEQFSKGSQPVALFCINDNKRIHCFGIDVLQPVDLDRVKNLYKVTHLSFL